MIVEEWKPVVGYEGVYEVSNTGRVRKGQKLLKTDDIVCLCRYGKKAGRSIARLVYEAFVGTVSDGMYVTQKDLGHGFHPDNLMLLPRTQARRANTAKHTELAGSKRLRVIELDRYGMTFDEIARRVNLPRREVGEIIREHDRQVREEIARSSRMTPEEV